MHCAKQSLWITSHGRLDEAGFSENTNLEGETQRPCGSKETGEPYRYGYVYYPERYTHDGSALRH